MFVCSKQHAACVACCCSRHMPSNACHVALKSLLVGLPAEYCMPCRASPFHTCLQRQHCGRALRVRAVWSVPTCAGLCRKEHGHLNVHMLNVHMHGMPVDTCSFRQSCPVCCAANCIVKHNHVGKKGQGLSIVLPLPVLTCVTSSVYGLYGAFLPAAFGSSKELAVGPVAVTSLLISSSLKGVVPGSADITNPVGVACWPACWVLVCAEWEVH